MFVGVHSYDWLLIPCWQQDLTWKRFLYGLLLRENFRVTAVWITFHCHKKRNPLIPHSSWLAPICSQDRNLDQRPDVIRPDRTKSMNLAPWNAGIDDPWKHAAPLKSYRAKFGRSRSNGTPILTDIRRKKYTLSSRLLRSLKVTGTNTNRSAAYDLLQWSTVTTGLISLAISEINGYFGGKSQIFPTPCVFNAHALTECFLELCNGGEIYKSCTDDPTRSSRCVTTCACI